MHADHRAGDQRDAALLRQALAAQLAVEALLLQGEQLELGDLEGRGGGADVREPELQDAHAPAVLDRAQLGLDLLAHPLDIRDRLAGLAGDHLLHRDHDPVLQAGHEVVDLDEGLAQVDDLVEDLAVDLVDEVVVQLDDLGLQVQGRVLGLLDLEGLQQRHLEVDAGTDHGAGASEGVAEGVRAVVDDHEQARECAEDVEGHGRACRGRGAGGSVAPGPGWPGRRFPLPGVEPRLAP